MSFVHVTDVALQHELESVRQQLGDGIAELHAPLADLVRSQLDESFSTIQAGIVLATGVGWPDTDKMREQRILLAAALEMLRLALRIHHLLLGENRADSSQDVNKTRMGSIILAGDYCFSRSAILAAGTDIPIVVQIFANALKQVSEEELRSLFQPLPNLPPRESSANQSFQDEALIQAGVAAAAQIALLAPHEQETIAKFVQSPAFSKVLLIPQLPLHQQARWRSLFDLHRNAA